jgi:hypothetical protein
MDLIEGYWKRGGIAGFCVEAFFSTGGKRFQAGLLKRE